MRFAPAPGVPRVPDARAAAEALRGGACARRGVTRRAGPLGRPRRRRRRHPHAGAGAGRRARGRAVGDADPPRRPARRDRASRRTRSGRGCRARRSGARLWRRARPRSSGAGCARARSELNETRRAAGPARRWTTSTAGSRGGWRSSATFPQLEYPRAWPAAARTSSGRCSGSRRSATSSCPPGDAPLVLVAPSTAQDRRASAAARGARGPGGPARPRAGDHEPAAARRAAGGARQRAARRLGLLRADDAALRRGRLPRRATARSCARWRAAASVVACPAAGDMNENAARVDWAGRGRPPAAAAGRRRGLCAWRCGGRCASRRCGRGRGSWRRGWPSAIRPIGRPSWSRSLPSGTRTSVRVRMEREWLAGRLAAGASYEELARDVGCSASTISYWARKHGLSSSHGSRHMLSGAGSRRGGVARPRSGGRVDPGHRAALDRSPTTVRHWMRRYGLQTPAAVRARGRAGRASVRDCGAGADLSAPRSDTARPARRRFPLRDGVDPRTSPTATAREAPVDRGGGRRCVLCGYDRCAGALQFHHVDPADKALRDQRSGRDGRPRQGSGRGDQMRAAMRELPR